jgi:hypothetical protein
MNMKHIILTSFMALSLIGAMAQNKTINDPNAVKRSVSGFHGVSVGGGVDLYLSQGDEAVVVSASISEDRDRIITEVVNGELQIHYDYHGLGWTHGGKHLKAYVSAKNLDRLHAGGGSDVYIDGVFHSDKMDVDLSGGSDGHGELSAGALRITISGGSDSHFKGRANDLVISATGGSDFLGKEFSADHVSANATGGSDVYITVNKELDVRASGGSDVHYSGSGTIREINSSGGSSVKRAS